MLQTSSATYYELASNKVLPTAGSYVFEGREAGKDARHSRGKRRSPPGLSEIKNNQYIEFSFMLTFGLDFAKIIIMSDIINKFKNATVFLMANSETVSLKKAVDIINSTCSPNDIARIIVFLKSETCPSYTFMQSIQHYEEYRNIDLIVQKAENIKEAFCEMPPFAVGSHFIIMGSDLEMDPYCVSRLIEEAKENPDMIICASKWDKLSSVSGYGFFHRIATQGLNKALRLIVGKKCTDIVSHFEIFPLETFNNLNIAKNKYFIFEYCLKPLISGAKYKEIPVSYIRRKEGKSNFNVIHLSIAAFEYIFIALKLKTEKLLDNLK